ncbi:DUF5994 family protein [Nocardia tengchongensis]|uniref:DUF5994 family protein n=1 Tax=Nocardia tengchongensis TaxID=2055889 RepID=UPI0036A23CEF
MPQFSAGRVFAGPISDRTQPFPAPTRTPRLLLHERGVGTGDVDGAWWPWTANLTAELHDLISAVTPRMGPIARIGFDWNAKSLAQRGIDGADGVELLGPGLGQPPAVMRLMGTDGGRLTLLVIPFDTPVHEADEQMRQAAQLHPANGR